MPKFKIEHKTTYTYEVPVRDSANQIMLYPFDEERQQVLFHRLQITADPVIELHKDIFDNQVGTFTHSQSHRQLVINSKLEVLTIPVPLPSHDVDPLKQWDSLKKLRVQFPFIEFLRNETFDSIRELRKAMDQVDDLSKGPLHCAERFNEYVYTNFAYQKGITTVDTTLEEIWKLRSGVCQDFAHILLAMLKQVNIPARYVSGYICPNENGMRGEGATHAWVEAYIPDYGWVGLDPTNNCIANENHVRLAVGKNYYDCSPVRGTYRGTSPHTLEVAVTVGYEGVQSPSVQDVVAQQVSGVAPQKNSFRQYQEMQMQQQQ